MGGLHQNSDDYKWICERFMDSTDNAYDLENYDAENIWKDPTREFYKNKAYKVKQFKQSLTRLVAKLQATRGTG
jgi:hypothetical protein